MGDASTPAGWYCRRTKRVTLGSNRYTPCSRCLPVHGVDVGPVRPGEPLPFAWFLRHADGSCYGTAWTKEGAQAWDARGGGNFSTAVYTREAFDAPAHRARISAEVPHADTVDALRDIIEWALGERDDFPVIPDRIEGKPYPFYWWRSELRRRYRAAVGAASGREEA